MIETKSKSDIKILKLSYKMNIDATQLCPNILYLYMYYGPKHGWFSKVYIPASNDCITILSNIKYYLHVTKLIPKAL